MTSKWLQQPNRASGWFPKKERSVNVKKSGDILNHFGPQFQQGINAINGDRLSMFNIGLKAGVGKSGLDVNYVGLMDLGPDGENNLILSDDGKKDKGPWLVIRALWLILLCLMKK